MTADTFVPDARVPDAAPPDAHIPQYQWVTGDTHVHSHGCGGNATPADLVAELVSQDLDVGNALIWGAGLIDDVDFFTGEDDLASVDGHILHYDLEVSAFAASWLGHLNVLGLNDLAFSLAPYESPISGLPIVDWALEQGPRVVVGMNHGGSWPADRSFPSVTCCTPFEFPVHVARERISFLELEWGGAGQPLSPGAARLWAAVQNSGFRIALTGASDFPCIQSELGAVRTRVLIDGELSFDTYLEALRAGRTVLMVGASEWVDFQIGDARIGDELQVAADATLAVTISASLAEEGAVELYSNAELVDSFAGVVGEQSFSTNITATQSAWLSVRSPRSQTSSIYVVVDGQPIRPSPDAACYLATMVQGLIDMVATGAQGDYSEYIPEYEAARDEYLTRFSEAGGTTCTLE